MDLDDVVKLVQPKDRDRSQWAGLGRHHGQACVARLLRSDPLPPHLHDCYLRAVVAGLSYEMNMAAGTVEVFYWQGYIKILLLYATSETHAKHSRAAAG